MSSRLNKSLSKAKKKVRQVYQKVQNVLFKTLPSALGVPLAILLAVAPIALAGYMYYLGKNSHPSSFTVMVTNLSERGGGSGVIVLNSPSESVVLTNDHVCSVLEEKGGKIKLTNGKTHLVTGYLTDIEHDLCLLTVAADLGQSISIASKAPELYSEAVVTGHPALMPNIITKGHFGGKEIIQIIVGFKKCTEADKKDPEKGIFCAFFGMAPIVRNFEAQVVSATIMSGSSGSAVLNSKGELSGLVFAGNARGISYAYVVPFEAVQNFISSSLVSVTLGEKWRPWLFDSSSEEDGEEMLEKHSAKNKALQSCTTKTIENNKLLDFCKKISEGYIL